VLWIIQKLDDIEVAVGGLDQVSLRSSAHLADQAARVNRHVMEAAVERLLRNAVPLEII
jgi:hypothetical protein